jgi:hypothetical protein
MSPRVLPDHTVKLERVALIAPSDPDAKPKGSSRFDNRVPARWLRIPGAVAYSGINRSRLFKLLAQGVIKSACLKEHRGAKRGLRLIDRFSLDLYLEKLSKPVEERLVTEFNELLSQEQELTKQQQFLAQKQRAIQQQLTQIRARPSPDAT